MKERTTAYLGFKLKNKEGRLETPTGLTYRVDCMTTRQAVRPFTQITPTAEGEVVLTAEDMAIRSIDNPTETKRVTLVAVYGESTDRITAEFDIKVERAEYVV
jgi:hypothetical protein